MGEGVGGNYCVVCETRCLDRINSLRFSSLGNFLNKLLYEMKINSGGKKLLIVLFSVPRNGNSNGMLQRSSSAGNFHFRPTT